MEMLFKTEGMQLKTIEMLFRAAEKKTAKKKGVIIMAIKILLPKLGITMSEGKITRWLKNEGDYVNKGEPLCEIETDKALMEVESTSSGYLKKILVNEEETVPVTTVIAILAEDYDGATKD